jgi:hypothetical protein
MPGGARSVLFVKFLDLWITEVAGIVAAPMTEVDPSDEGKISLRMSRVSKQHQLLVV